MIVFDIETSAIEFSEIEKYMPPFESPAELPEFDVSSVKFGNTKNEEKRAEMIEKARAAHEAAKADYPKLVESQRQQHIADFLSKAALSATTARVLVIGYYSVEKDKVVIDDGKGDESKLIVNFWRQYQTCRAAPKKLVGLNIFDFDLPFLVRRSWIHGIDVPATLMKDDRYWDTNTLVDLRKRWLCGQQWNACPSNFDAIAKALGTTGKNGQSGADFARLWHEDRNAAIEYLSQDLKQPAVWAARMGLI